MKRPASLVMLDEPQDFGMLMVNSMIHRVGDGFSIHLGEYHVQTIGDSTVYGGYTGNIGDTNHLFLQILGIVDYCVYYSTW